mgnify:CR=1 FL=1
MKNRGICSLNFLKTYSCHEKFKNCPIILMSLFVRNYIYTQAIHNLLIKYFLDKGAYNVCDLTVFTFKNLKIWKEKILSKVIFKK